MDTYIPMKIYLKNRNEPLVINMSMDEACLFQDWANENGAVANKFAHEKISVDDILTGSVFQIFRSHIQVIEYPFVCLVAEQGLMKTGTLVIDFEIFKKAKRRN